jgi:ATP-dependent protease ClpP protease subunit
MNWAEVINRDEDGVLLRVTGEIVGPQTARDVIAMLGDAQAVVVHLDCFGGNLGCGIELGEYLAARETTVRVFGRACSAAVPIMLAGKHIVMTANSHALIHPPACAVVGNAEEIRMRADMLDGFTQQLARTIMKRTGQPADIVAGWLAAESYFDASECLALGLCDRIAPAETALLASRLNDASLADAPPHASDEQERLVLDLLNAVGPITVPNLRSFFQKLSVWFNRNTTEAAGGRPSLASAPARSAAAIPGTIS